MSASLPLPRTVRPAPLDVSSAALQLVDENGVDDDSPSGAYGAHGGPGRGMCLDRSRMVVLVSPSFYRQRKAFYAGYCEVRRRG
jgi:hypothetical protein